MKHQFINEIKTFKQYLKNNHDLNNFSKNLETYYTFTFEKFLIEMNKKKAKINNENLLKTQFENSKNVLLSLNEKYELLDNQLNQIVYMIYGINSGIQIGIWDTYCLIYLTPFFPKLVLNPPKYQ